MASAGTEWAPGQAFPPCGTRFSLLCNGNNDICLSVLSRRQMDPITLKRQRTAGLCSGRTAMPAPPGHPAALSLPVATCSLPPPAETVQTPGRVLGTPASSTAGLLRSRVLRTRSGLPSHDPHVQEQGQRSNQQTLIRSCAWRTRFSTRTSTGQPCLHREWGSP